MPSDRRTHADRRVEAEDRLTQALVELIAEQGYERTTAAQIGERAGYSRAAVRDRYGSKDDLLRALHLRYEELLVGGAARPASFAEFLGRLRAFAAERPEWLRAILVVSFESVGTTASFAPVVRQWVETLQRLATDLLEAERGRGVVRADLDPERLGPQLVDEAVGAMYRWTLQDEAADYASLVDDWAVRVVARLQ